MRPSDIQAWVKRLLTVHRLAPSTSRVVHGVLASMFKSAVRDRTVLALEAAMPARWRTMVPRGASR